MNEKRCFPLFVDISGRKIVVIGAGGVAARRVETLLDFGGQITVVAPRVSLQIGEMAQKGRITLHRRPYRREDILDAWMVLAATDDAKLNGEIYGVAKCLGALVNMASDQTKCDFQFPAIARSGSLVVGINTAGTDHAKAAAWRRRIEEQMRRDGDEG